MELKKVNSLQFEAAETTFAGFAKARGTPILNPLVGTWPLETGFSCDHQVCGIRM